LSKPALSLILILASLAGLTPLAIDMYLPSMPAIALSLATSEADVQRTLSVFLAGFAISQLAYGPIADAIGRRKTMFIGMALFIVASLACALAPSMPALYLSRLLQAVGGASTAVVMNALIRDLFSHEQFSRVMSVIMLTMTLAPLVAPVLGGAIVAYAHWRLIFVVLALLGLVALIAFALKIPETLPVDRRQPIRPAAVLRNYGNLLTHRRAIGYMLCAGLSFGGMFTFLTASPFVYIEYYHVPAELYGFLVGLNIPVMMLGTFLNGRLVGRVGTDRMALAGCLVLTGAGLWLARLSVLPTPASLWQLVPGIVLFAGTMAVIGGNCMAGVLNDFSHMSGTASALAGTVRFGGGALGGLMVSLLHSTDYRAMAQVMALCGVLSLASLLLALSGRKKEAAVRI